MRFTKGLAHEDASTTESAETAGLEERRLWESPRDRQPTAVDSRNTNGVRKPKQRKKEKGEERRSGVDGKKR